MGLEIREVPRLGDAFGAGIRKRPDVVYYDMISVPEAARRTGRNPETVRRWIREGKLPARKIGTQHFIEVEDLNAVVGRGQAPLPPKWTETITGEPMPDWVAAIRRSRAGR